MNLRKFSLLFRVIHWSIAFCMLFMLLTVFLRLTWMNKTNIGNILQESLSKNSVVLSQEDAVKIGKDIRKPMWEWHIYIGYVLIFLFLSRMLAAFLGRVPFLNPLVPNLSLQEKLQAWVYLTYYFLLFLTLLTGFLIVNGPKTYKPFLESVHELSLYYTLAFLVLHIGGVILAELGEKKGIISNMISGD
jgi:cytochrome b561